MNIIKRYIIIIIKLILTALIINHSPMVNSSLAATSDPEGRVQELFKITRCLICNGESIQHSRTEFSSRMRDLIMQEIRSGKSDQEIKDHLREIYGEQVLFEPPFVSYTYLLWLLPAALLILGVLLTYRQIYLAKNRAKYNI